MAQKTALVNEYFCFFVIFYLQCVVKTVILNEVFLSLIFNIIKFTIMADLKLDHNFCVDFREEISRHGISGVITELLDSKSVNVPNKKKYLARECGKKGAFKAQLENAFSTLITSQPHKKAALKGLKDEIFLLIPAKK